MTKLRVIVAFIAVLMIVRAAWRGNYARYLATSTKVLRQTHAALLIPEPYEQFLHDVREAVPSGSSVVVLLPQQPATDPFPGTLTRRAMYVLAGRDVEQFQPGRAITADFVIAWNAPPLLDGYRAIWTRYGGALLGKAR